jgi:hypothetical protein
VEHLKGWTRSDHYQEAVRLHEEANHVGHEDEQRGLGILVSSLFHATLAGNPDLLRLQERTNHLT